jgi:hypothetical protein
MSSLTRQAATLRALIQGSTKFSGVAQRSAVIDELTEVINCAKVQPTRRRRLLQFLHTARALESTARDACLTRGLGLPQKPGMTAYLNRLANSTPPTIPQALRNQCETRVANIRNPLAHAANAYPLQQQLDAGFVAAAACVTILI